jgi:hypothetical protein
MQKGFYWQEIGNLPRYGGWLLGLGLLYLIFYPATANVLKEKMFRYPILLAMLLAIPTFSLFTFVILYGFRLKNRAMIGLTIASIIVYTISLILGVIFFWKLKNLENTIIANMIDGGGYGVNRQLITNVQYNFLPLSQDLIVTLKEVEQLDKIDIHILFLILNACNNNTRKLKQYLCSFKILEQDWIAVIHFINYIHHYVPDDYKARLHIFYVCDYLDFVNVKILDEFNVAPNKNSKHLLMLDSVASYFYIAMLILLCILLYMIRVWKNKLRKANKFIDHCGGDPMIFEIQDKINKMLK